MLQLVPHPVHQRKRKPLLSPVQHFTRNANPLRQFLQNVLSRSGSKFVLHRQSCDPFNELMIEKGKPDLERCGHAHSIVRRQDNGEGGRPVKVVKWNGQVKSGVSAYRSLPTTT